MNRRNRKPAPDNTLGVQGPHYTKAPRLRGSWVGRRVIALVPINTPLLGVIPKGAELEVTARFRKSEAWELVAITEPACAITIYVSDADLRSPSRFKWVANASAEGQKGAGGNVPSIHNQLPPECLHGTPRKKAQP